MAKVDINIIKEWFRNLKKPNQDQFWAWLDSFRHKDDKIPMDDVTNLTQTLTKKADLVGGVVPPHQLPFMIAGNEVLEIGSITATHNRVSIAVHESGSNKVRIDGQILVRDFPDSFLFTSVTAGSKFLRVVAKNATGLFFLKEGVESGEPQEPSLDAGEVHVRLILVTPEGNVIDPETLNGFVEKEEESWKTITVSASTNFSINKTDKRTRFKVRSTNDIPKVLQSIVFSEETSRALEIWIYNDTNLNFSIPNSATNGLSKGFTTAQPPFIILPKTYAKLKYNPGTDLIECWRVNSAGDNSGGISSVNTDSTLQGDGSESDPLGLSASKNAEIAGKISKQGINLWDSGNISEMKTGDISGIYRGNASSNPVYADSPFLQMTTADTFAQIHIHYVNGEMSYRAGYADGGYSALRTSWDTGNLVDPATQAWVNTRNFLAADAALVAGFVAGNKEVPYIRHSDMTIVALATTNWVTNQTTPATQAEVEASTGTESEPTFDEPATENRKLLSLFNFFKLIKKLRYIHLLPNSAPAIANRLRSDGSRLHYANNSAIESTVAYTSDLPTTFIYEPTGNFKTSDLKTEAEKAGLIFNGLHFIIKIGTNNYTCTVDNGASNSETVITFGKRGTGSIAFMPNPATPSRILNAGADNITVMNGNVNSLAMLNFDTSVDFLTIYNNQ